MRHCWHWLGCLLLLVLPEMGRAQLTVIIDAVPSYTPASDTLYLVGSFNNWNPRDERFQFEKMPSGQWQYQFLTPLPDFEYKITRGEWAKVEGGQRSEPIANRQYQHLGKVEDTIRIQIAGWEDLSELVPFLDTLQLCVTSMPENTPPDASLYVVGSFNGWSPGDPDYKLIPQSETDWCTTIPIRDAITEYKVTRGSWPTAESRVNGLARPNRIFNYYEDDAESLLQLTVANWEDLSYNGIGWYNIILLLAALQGLLLVVTINSLKERRSKSNRILSLLLVLLSVALLARIGGFQRTTFQQYPKIILLPDLLFFSYGPLFWLYLRSLTPKLPENRHWGWHFLPLLLFVLSYGLLLRMSDFDFITQVVNLQFRPYFVAVAMIGWIFSAFYWWRSRVFLLRLDRAIGKDTLPVISFVKSVFHVHTLCLLVWLLAYVVGGIGHVLDMDYRPVTDVITDAAWVILALAAYAMGFYAMRQPQIFREPQLALTDLEEQSPISFDTGVSISKVSEAEHLAPAELLAVPTSAPTEFDRLEVIMQEQRPYLNAGLTLAELASLAGLPSHQLSKVINDNYGKNFFDYVNAYRIAAFQQRIDRGDHQDRTILSLALESGFNSKTAFNRAFKKQTGVTPREYLRQ